MPPMTFRVFLAAAATALMSSSVAAQAIAERPLPAPTRTFTYEFTNVVAVQPLPGGSLLAADMNDMNLVYLDGRTGAGRVVGRTGSGPLEYRTVGQLLLLPGDTVAMYDAAQARMLLVSPTGAPVRTVSWGTDMLAALSRPQIFATDRRGRVYGLQLPPLDPQRGMIVPDTLPVVRMASITATRIDTIARVWQGQEMRAQPSMGADGKIHMAMPLTLLLPADEPAVLPDGRLAVVRGDRYVVEWIAEDGTRRSSAPVPSTRLPVTAADRKNIADETRTQAEAGMKQGARMLPAGTAMPELVLDEPPSWPATRPHFNRGVRAGTDGRLFVPVPCVAAGARCLDVLDTQAKRVARYKLPKSGRVLAAGTGVIYVVAKDEDDLEYVYVHRIP